MHLYQLGKTTEYNLRQYLLELYVLEIVIGTEHNAHCCNTLNEVRIATTYGSKSGLLATPAY